MTVKNIITRINLFSKILESTECSINGSYCELEEGQNFFYKLVDNLKKNNGSLYIIGNGGSAGVASHSVNDFFNVVKIKAYTLHDPSLFSCFANDYGYEFVFSKQIDQIISKDDLLIAISSSGNSANITNAVNAAKTKNAQVITLSGFNKENKLRSMGLINFWLNSTDYGFVEIGHQFLLHNIVDRFNPTLS